MLKYANSVSHDKRCSLRAVYAWLANGAVTSRGKNTYNSAISRYAPFYAYGWLKQLNASMPWAIKETWRNCEGVVNTLSTNHFKSTTLARMANARISLEHIQDLRTDLILYFLNTYIPMCAPDANDFTTIGDFAFYRFSKDFPYVLLELELKALGIADSLQVGVNDTAAYKKAIIAYKYWQSHADVDPLAYLYKYGYINAKTRATAIDTYLDVFKRLAYCTTQVPVTQLGQFNAKGLRHLGGLLENDSVDREVLTIC